MSSMSAFIALLVVLAVVFLALKLRTLVHHGILGPSGSASATATTSPIRPDSTIRRSWTIRPG